VSAAKIRHLSFKSPMIKFERGASDVGSQL
jgi:hypothetical protein